MRIGASGYKEGVGDAVGSSSFSASSSSSSSSLVACGFSSSASSSCVGAAEGGSWLLELPRDCLVRVLSFLSPLDVCRMARVCRVLRALADSDEIWVRRLPSKPPIEPSSISKKDLYFRIRAGILRKDFSQPYWLDPLTGKGCFVKSARDLEIVWGEDERYWRWEQQPDSWFTESACLHDVCWFEVRGDFESVFMPGAYRVSFRIAILDGLRGWEGIPVKLSLSTSNGQHVESRQFFHGNRGSIVAPISSLGSSLRWKEIGAGEFVVETEMRVKVQFSMMEIEGGRWKKGVIVDCVKIQPSCALLKDS